METKASKLFIQTDLYKNCYLPTKLVPNPWATGKHTKKTIWQLKLFLLCFSFFFEREGSFILKNYPALSSTSVHDS